MISVKLRTFVLLVFVGASCSMLTGCSYVVTAHVSGVVTGADDGKPLVGVKVFATHDGTIAQGEPMAQTEADGKFSFTVKRAGNGKDDQELKCVLVCTADGFQTATADLSFVHFRNTKHEHVSVNVPMKEKR